MLPALTTKPKQAVRQVKGLTNDSIDSYSNMPLGGTYVDNTETASPLATGRATINTGRTLPFKSSSGESEATATLARVVRDRKASGEEELSLRTGDIVKVMSTKRIGYLKCESGNEIGYVPSSYLEFLDGGAETENGNSSAKAQRVAEKQHKKQQKKAKRKKEKRDGKDDNEPDEAASVGLRSLRKAGQSDDERNELPRKTKKKDQKHHQNREASGDTQRDMAFGADEPSSTARSHNTPDDSGRSRGKGKHSKKKRHRDVDSDDSRDSDEGKRSGRHRRRRRHRRGSSDSDSGSTSSDGSDRSYRRRRRRRRHRHQRSFSEDEEDDDIDHKRRSRRSKKYQDKDDEPEEVSRSTRKAEKEKLAATLQEVQKAVSQIDVKSDEKVSEPTQVEIAATSLNTKEESSQDKEKKEDTERNGGKFKAQAASVSTSRKNDESRSSSSTSTGSKQNGNKSGLGRQIGEKVRSFLSGGKKQHGHKSSSGILDACSGTIQGEEGWYEHGENERYYFVLIDGKWSLLYGPMSEDDYEAYSNRVLEQNRTIELPPTYLHKSGYYLNLKLRVQRGE